MSKVRVERQVFAVRIPAPLLARLRDEATRYGRTIQWITEDALRRWLIAAEEARTQETHRNG